MRMVLEKPRQKVRYFALQNVYLTLMDSTVTEAYISGKLLRCVHVHTCGCRHPYVHATVVSFVGGSLH